MLLQNCGSRGAWGALLYVGGRKQGLEGAPGGRLMDIGSDLRLHITDIYILSFAEKKSKKCPLGQ